MHDLRRRLENEIEVRARWFLLIAAYPRLARVAQPAAYLAARGFVVYVAAKTLVLFGTWVWVAPRLQRWSTRVVRERDAASDRLGRELGREPTDDELIRALVCARRERRRARASARS
jgi:hypothetical protein